AVDAVPDSLLGGRRPAVAALRTTCGRWLAEAGVPWTVIAAQLGYHDVASFARRNLDLLAPTAHAQ
ncbi:hypothetical protein ACW9HQ_40765, partial [Nocardia gipuzkoensis]